MSPAPREQQQALFEAYVAATGLAVHLSHSRRFVLQALVERGITPEDVRAVVAALRNKIARGDSGFTDASLLFRNAMNADAMEERALLLRQQKLRAKGARPKPAAATTQTMPDGSTISRLAEAADDRPPLRVDGKTLTEAFAEAIGRKP